MLPAAHKVPPTEPEAPGTDHAPGTHGGSPGPQHCRRQVRARCLAGPVLTAALAATLPSGCSTESLYSAVHGWQRNECNRFADADQRTRCLAGTETSYSDYQHQRRAATGTP